MGQFDDKSPTGLFRALSRDVLMSKKFRRAIGNVGLRHDGSGGIVAFWIPQWNATHFGMR